MTHFGVLLYRNGLTLSATFVLVARSDDSMYSQCEWFIRFMSSFADTLP